MNEKNRAKETKTKREFKSSLFTAYLVKKKGL